MAEYVGKVWLAGAGPGDAGLLTIRTKEVMGRADVVVYDALVSVEVLSQIPEGREMIFVGKRMDYHPVPQQEINEILIKKAREGKTVLRLKGGDPFIFGRGGEEAEALVCAGIPFEMIPGITSASAAAAYAGIPLTHRDQVSSFHVVTAHPRKDGSDRINFHALVQAKGTLVFLMGRTSLGTICRKLMEAGMDPKMPASIVERGTQTRQKCVISTVEALEVEARKAEIGTPALILVGEVCRASEILSWRGSRPLDGRQIIVTRPERSGGALAAILREQGAQVIEYPTIRIQEIRPNRALETAVEELGSYPPEEWLVFTSAIGVQTFFGWMRDKELDIRKVFGGPSVVRIAAIGGGTAEKLKQFGLIADLIPEVYCAAELGKKIAEKADPGSHVTVVRAKNGSKELLPPMEEKNLLVKDIPIYETLYRETGALDEQVRNLLKYAEIDAVTFTSGSTVRGFVQALGEELSRQVTAVCIGNQTAQEAAGYGMRTVTAQEASIVSLAETLMNELKNQGGTRWRSIL